MTRNIIFVRFVLREGKKWNIRRRRPNTVVQCNYVYNSETKPYSERAIDRILDIVHIREVGPPKYWNLDFGAFWIISSEMPVLCKSANGWKNQNLRYIYIIK